MKRVLTIGVCGWDLDSLLEALGPADVRLLADVRQRRGVRGREYAWANAVRLQTALSGYGIAYRHHKGLAPTTELHRIAERLAARLGAIVDHLLP